MGDGEEPAAALSLLLSLLGLLQRLQLHLLRSSAALEESSRAPATKNRNNHKKKYHHNDDISEVKNTHLALK